MEVDLHSYGVAGMFLAMVFAPALVGARSSREESRRLSAPRPKKRSSIKESDREAELLIANATLGSRRAHPAYPSPNVVQEPALQRVRPVSLPLISPAQARIAQPAKPESQYSPAFRPSAPQSQGYLQATSAPPAQAHAPARPRTQWVETHYAPQAPLRRAPEPAAQPAAPQPAAAPQQEPIGPPPPPQMPHPYLQQPYYPHAGHPVPYPVMQAAMMPPPQPWPMPAYYPFGYGMQMYPAQYAMPYPPMYPPAPQYYAPMYPQPYAYPAQYPAPQPEPPADKTHRGVSR